MPDDEALREALVELKALREREGAALRESNALLEGLKRVKEAGTPAEALGALLGSIRASLDCDAVLLLTPAGSASTVKLATDAALAGLSLPAEVMRPGRPARVADARLLDWWERAPAALCGVRAMLSVPLALPDAAAGAIRCLSRTPARFAPADLGLLSRLALLVAPALASLALSQRNALLAAVIDGSAASVCIADARQGGMPLVYVNDAFVSLTGYAREEVLGRNCRFLSAQDGDAPERARLRAAVAGGGSGTFELLNRRRDGTEFWNRLTLFPIGDEEGVQFLVATQVDITAERAAAEERDKARRRLIAALSATSEGFLLLDADGRVVLANPPYRDFFEDGGAELAEGVPFVDVWRRRLEHEGMAPERAAAMAEARLSALLAGGKDREEKLPDGRILLLNDRPTADGGAVSIATDVTSLKATERILAQRAAAIDATQDGIAVTDESGRFVYMNPSHLAMFGYRTETEVLGRHWSVLYPRDQAERIERIGMPELERTGRWMAEIAGRTRDGRPVEQEVSLTLLAGIGIVCVTRDASERQQVERERSRLRDQLHAAQRQEAIGQLAAGVAHDFNNLLSVITTSTAIAEHDLTEDHPVRPHLARVGAAAGRATRLVTRLLDLGGRKTETVRLDARTVLGEASDLLRAGMPSRVGVGLELPDEALMIEADPTDLMQVALNLGINARDAIGEAAGRVALAASVETAGTDGPAPLIGSLSPGQRYLVLSVSDDGCGMSAETLEQVFRPYFTTKGTEGTGLGLAVVSSIATKIDGAVTVSSAEGEGSTFRLHWPLDTAGPGEAAPVAAAPETPVALEGATVLVCDDIPDVGQSIAAVLEQAGAEAAVCEDPRDALEVVTEDPSGWSLMVTDYDMPGMNGTELARAVRTVAPGLPIVLCTALAEGRRQAKLFDAALAKPVTPDALMAAIARAMAPREADAARPGPVSLQEEDAS